VAQPGNPPPPVIAGGRPTSPAAPLAGAPTYRLVTQAAWLRHGPAMQARATGASRDQGGKAPKGQAGATRTWFQGHPALVLHAEVARSFRAKHPGGRLLVDWLERPLARNALRGAPGWLSVKG